MAVPTVGEHHERDAWVAGGLSVVALMAIWLIAVVAHGTPLAFMRPADDAYYYFDLVRSIWGGDGFTTDGVHSTNGFHPLWFLVLLPAGAVLRGTGDGLVVLAQIMSVVLLGISVAGVTTACRMSGCGRVTAVVGGLALWFPPWRGIASAGVEGALALALLSWTVVAALRATMGSRTTRHLVLFGVLAGLSVLARLDSVFVAGFLLLAILVTAERRDRLRSAALLIAPPVLLVGAYLLANLFATGSPFPITASLKSSFPEWHLRPDFVVEFAPFYLALAPAWLGAALSRRKSHFSVVLALAVGSTAFATYLGLFGRGVFWWHFVSVVPAGAIGIGIVLEELGGRYLVAGRRLRQALIAAAALAAVLPAALSLFERSPDGEFVARTGWRVESARAGRWAATNLPSDVMLAMKDSGAFGFYTPQPMMNLDGVFSNRSFQEEMCAGRAGAEMRTAGVQYLAYHAVPSDYESYTVELPCWSEGTHPSRLTMSKDDEVYRGDTYWHNRPSRFVIWRFAEDSDW